jgi:hypothetical protein
MAAQGSRLSLRITASKAKDGGNGGFRKKTEHILLPDARGIESRQDPPAKPAA